MALNKAALNIASGVLGYTCEGVAACMHGWEATCVKGKVKQMWSQVFNCVYVNMAVYMRMKPRKLQSENLIRHCQQVVTAFSRVYAHTCICILAMGSSNRSCVTL